jgi:hypothetical protein
MSRRPACTRTLFQLVFPGFNNTMDRNTLIALVIGGVLTVGAVYMLFFKHADTSATLTASLPSSPVESTFVNLIEQLGHIQFDTSILSDPRFLSLQDIHTAVFPESSGRKDPFAPLPGYLPPTTATR